MGGITSNPYFEKGWLAFQHIEVEDLGLWPQKVQETIIILAKLGIYQESHGYKILQNTRKSLQQQGQLRSCPKLMAVLLRPATSGPAANPVAAKKAIFDTKTDAWFSWRNISTYIYITHITRTIYKLLY